MTFNNTTLLSTPGNAKSIRSICDRYLQMAEKLDPKELTSFKEVLMYEVITIRRPDQSSRPKEHNHQEGTPGGDRRQ